MAQVAPLFSTSAADRTECYNLIAFGSQNCCVYCDSFPREDGRYQLTQLFNSNDRVSSEWCDKERGVCKQARDAAGDLTTFEGEYGFVVSTGSTELALRFRCGAAGCERAD